ncbi:MAG: hypothetical protein HYZ53_26565 [Planctomycetes bacterium]|nr:hypothetical protein [Planctomycetota bacterium]
MEVLHRILPGAVTLAAALSLTLCPCVPAQPAGPRGTVRIQESPPATLMDLVVKDMPALEAAERVAKAMGFEKVLDPKGACGGKTFTGTFKERPAWECLVAILEKADATWGGGTIGDDYALNLFPAAGTSYRYAVQGGLVARFSQVEIGHHSTDPMHDRPSALWLLGEPRLSWSFAEVSVADQKDAAGKSCDLLGLDLFSGRPQQRPGKDPADPWPGLSAFAVRGKLQRVPKTVAVEIAGLALGCPRTEAVHGGNEVATLESLGRDGRFVLLEFSFPSTAEGESVRQGGWGAPPEESLETFSGVRAELTDEQGARVSPTVLVVAGDGKRARVTFKLNTGSLDKAGGIEKTRLRLWLPLEKATDTVAFEFKDLVAKR